MARKGRPTIERHRLTYGQIIDTMPLTMKSKARAAENSRLMQAAWIVVFSAFFIWSAIGPRDYPTWFVEVLPAIVGAAILWFTRRRFPLTPLTYLLILIHSVILIVGGHYTYAEVPLFDWISDALGHARNNYDKLGHFVQGFVPAIIAREITIRKGVFSTAAWRNFFIVSMCLGISAFYELIEWMAALLSVEASESFLGTQGYVWDTQSDMAFALAGAIVALTLLSRLHDRQLAWGRTWQSP
jgi:putative membrane protein